MIKQTSFRQVKKAAITGASIAAIVSGVCSITILTTMEDSGKASRIILANFLTLVSLGSVIGAVVELTRTEDGPESMSQSKIDTLFLDPVKYKANTVKVDTIAEPMEFDDNDSED